MSRTLHQLLAGAAPGDAVTDQARAIRRWLRSQGLRSDLYAESIHPALKDEVLPAARLGRDGDHLIYHYSIGSDTIGQAMSLGSRLVLIYHNVTPPGFVAGVDPGLAAKLEEGRRRLSDLVGVTDLALGDSAYNEADLAAAGYRRTGVLPILLDDEAAAVPPDPGVLARYGDGIANLLTVGRLMPHKRQEDAIKVLHFCRAGGLDARLIVVGSDWLPAYRQWLEDLADGLDLRQHVVFAGHVTQAGLNACYRVAHVYLTLSEHEGFCKPLIEAMSAGLPVVAYNAPAVAETLGEAGVLVLEKDFPAIAEVVGMVAQDEPLRSRLVRRGRERAERFTYASVTAVLAEHLKSANIT